MWDVLLPFGLSHSQLPCPSLGLPALTDFSAVCPAAVGRFRPAVRGPTLISREKIGRSGISGNLRVMLSFLGLPLPLPDGCYAPWATFFFKY